MVDIHTHVLPDYDDGPPNVDSTREMLQMAVRSGTTELVATPHILNNGDYRREKEIRQKFQLVKKLIEEQGYDLKLYLGSEVYLYPDTSLDHSISTLNNNKKYALVEFSLRTIPEFVPQKIFNWILDGYSIIIAHPERNLLLEKNPFYLFRFAQMGALLQLNSGSLTGVFGRKVKELSIRMIDHNLVHFIASDGHGVEGRSISMLPAYEIVEKRWGIEKARLLFEVNPRKAILGQEIKKAEPIPIEEKSVFARFGQWIKRLRSAD